jgi:DNA-binding NarL/FixJ family response regulator
MTHRFWALIVSRPGPLREGLQAALTALFLLEMVGVVDSAASAMDMAAEGDDPALVLVSLDEPANGVSGGLEWIRTRWPKVPFMVLANTVEQQLSAQAAGAEEVLIKGVRPEELMARIEGLLRRENQAAAA